MFTQTNRGGGGLQQQFPQKHFCGGRRVCAAMQFKGNQIEQLWLWQGATCVTMCNSTHHSEFPLVCHLQLLPTGLVLQETLQRCFVSSELFLCVSGTHGTAGYSLRAFRWFPKLELYVEWTLAPSVTGRGVSFQRWILMCICETICFFVVFVLHATSNESRHWAWSACLMKCVLARHETGCAYLCRKDLIMSR